jgi:putative ABC transport system permease protein
MPFMNVRIALVSLLRHRLRTSLTVLGIGIGIAAVICTAAIGAAGTAQVEKQIDAVGEDFLWIRAGSARVAGARTGFGGGPPTLTPEDATALQAEVPYILACSPVVQGREQLIAGAMNWNTRYQGVLPSFFSVRRRTLAAGTFFTAPDQAAAARVMVLGPSVAEQLFGAENPVGRSVRMNRFVFRIIGVLTPAGVSRGGLDRDDAVFVPLATAHRNLDRRDRVQDLMCGVRSPDDMGRAQAMAIDLLRVRHELGPDEPDDFQIQQPVEMLETRAEASRAMTVMLTAIGAISLVVGGVGIMNIMLVSVVERRREIGVRLAIGARVRDIQWQFLAEAAAIGLFGGALGLLAGWAAASWMSWHWQWPAAISPKVALLATVSAIGTGLLFGYYPAHRAAMLDPIDAIRMED